MARYQYVILSQAVEGKLTQFESWYDDQHLADVAKVPGIVSAKRFRVVHQVAPDLSVPAWCSLAIYEMETDDPHKVLAAIQAVAGTAAMPLSEALSLGGMLQLVAEPVS